MHGTWIEVLPRLYKGFFADRRQMSLPVACLRLLRVSPVLAYLDEGRALLDNEACRRHVAAVASSDFFFYLSHRHYLAQGFTRGQRTELARAHYEHEVSAYDEAYFDAVYRNGGLSLWRRDAEGTRFEVLLVPGSDALCEGGLTAVLRVDGGRVCVVSFSRADRATVFDRESESGSTLFVCRKQLASNHSWQPRFNAAFDRCSVAHFCMAAISGIALANGHASIGAVRPEVQASCTEDRCSRFRVSYGEFWESLGGRIRGRFAYEIPVPVALTPLADLTAKRRHRARRRRAHLAEIRESARAVIERHRL